MTVSRFVIRLIYTISSSSLPFPQPQAGERRGGRRARSARISLSDNESRKSGNGAQHDHSRYPERIVFVRHETTIRNDRHYRTICHRRNVWRVCVCMRAFYIDSQHGCFVMYDIYTRAIYYLHHHRHHIAEAATIYMYLQLFTESESYNVSICKFYSVHRAMYWRHSAICDVCRRMRPDTVLSSVQFLARDWWSGSFETSLSCTSAGVAGRIQSHCVGRFPLQIAFLCPLL